MKLIRSEAQADLRYFLPMKRGQRVLLFGCEPSLVDAVERDGCQAVQVYDPSQLTNLETASIDHAIAVIAGVFANLEIWCELARIMKAEGYIFAGAQNAHSIQVFSRRLFSNRYQQNPVTLHQALKRMALSGFKMESYYGLRTDLRQPAYIVPLMNVEPSRYFFEYIFAPYSVKAILLRKIAILLIRMGFQRLFFTDLGFLARRQPGDHVA